MWFAVDKGGLAKLLARKGKAFALHELIQNALDEQPTRIDVVLERIPAERGKVRLVVEDDAPDGFSNLTHAYTLFAESAKKSVAEKRGRWNLGEKLVLALCDWAEIRSTKGGVRFDVRGRHPLRSRRPAGTRFEGVLAMTDDDLRECDRSVRQLLLPRGVALVFNGSGVAARTPLKAVEATLATEVADGEGRLRPTRRKAVVEIHAVADGEAASLYEMGIPVVATGDRYHVNVLQKVPLGLDRDNVPPGYLARVRALVLEHMAAELDAEDMNAAWVRDAIGTHGASLPQDVIKHFVTKRLGPKAVAYDPSDPEANSRAFAAGYTVVHGAQLSGAEWDAVKRAGALPPAGRVTPSPKPYSASGGPVHLIPPEEWTEGMLTVSALALRLAQRLMAVRLRVEMAADVTWPYAATYTRTGDNDGTLVFNVGRLGRVWFDGDVARVLEILVHEFAHHFSSDHLCASYHKALCRLAADMTALALREPAAFAVTPNQG